MRSLFESEHKSLYELDKKRRVERNKCIALCRPLLSIVGIIVLIVLAGEIGKAQSELDIRRSCNETGTMQVMNSTYSCAFVKGK